MSTKGSNKQTSQERQHKATAQKHTTRSSTAAQQCNPSNHGCVTPSMISAAGRNCTGYDCRKASMSAIFTDPNRALLGRFSVIEPFVGEANREREREREVERERARERGRSRERERGEAGSMMWVVVEGTNTTVSQFVRTRTRGQKV